MARFLVLYDKTMPVKTPADIYVIEAIRKERMAQKVSQAMLAYGIGVSKGFIGMAESPKYDIKYNVNHMVPGLFAPRFHARKTAVIRKRYAMAAVNSRFFTSHS